MVKSGVRTPELSLTNIFLFIEAKERKCDQQVDSKTLTETACFKNFFKLQKGKKNNLIYNEEGDQQNDETSRDDNGSEK